MPQGMDGRFRGEPSHCGHLFKVPQDIAGGKGGAAGDAKDPFRLDGLMQLMVDEHTFGEFRQAHDSPGCLGFGFGPDGFAFDIDNNSLDIQHPVDQVDVLSL